MKYKAKFTGYNSFLVPILKEGDTIDSEGQKGVDVFIPFTDTRFFEPVKVRKFMTEVSEDNIPRFVYCNFNEDWTVTEITEDKYLEALKANREISPLVIEVLGQGNNALEVWKVFCTSLNDHGRNNKLSIVKDIKYFIASRFPQIDGLKNAKDKIGRAHV